ncbi:MAG: sugar transferase [Calditrichia bacterium]
MIHTMQQNQKKQVKANAAQSSNGTKNIAVMGLNYIGAYLYHHYKSENHRDKLVGIIHNSGNISPEDSGKDLNILGGITSLKDIVQENDISKLIIAYDYRDIRNIHEAIGFCRRYGISYEFVEPSYDVHAGINYIHVFITGIKSAFTSVQRLLDFLLSTILIVFFAPLYFLLSLLIKLESGGPAIVSQERVGKSNRIFRLYKFRTTRLLHSKLNGTFNPILDEPESLKIAKFLKKTALEDLPNILNIFNGDLSLVGPQPHTPYFAEKYEKDVPFYVNRLKVRPGLLGFAQVETAYDDSVENIRQQVKYDLYYADHYKSPWLNLKIIIKSVWMLAFGRI